MLRMVTISPDDYGALEVMLSENRLLASDLEGDNKRFYAFEDESGWRMGVGGFEIYGTHALVRSLVVVEEYRQRGHGQEMVEQLIETVAALGVTRLYLFTEHAEKFFKKLGFAPAERGDAPEGIQSSYQFTTHCGDGATFMMAEIGEGGS